MRYMIVCLILAGLLVSGRLHAEGEIEPRVWENKTTLLRREQSAAVFDSARGRIVLFGGIVDHTAVAETWEWAGDAWVRMRPEDSPKARAGHRMVFDEQRGKTVLFGGFDQDGIGLGDTWEWDGVNWAPLETPTAPAARAWHAMAYDSKRHGVLLFGGTTCVDSMILVNGCGWTGTWERFGDLWSWDGTTWTLVSSGSSPPARFNADLAYDRARDHVVLFGGSGGDGTLADTWEWDGMTWEDVSPAASPPGRSSHSLAYDEERQITLLAAGVEDGSSTLPEKSWKWDGVAWTSAGHGLRGRANASMFYDPTEKKVVLLGGEGDDFKTLPMDLWVWDGFWTAAPTVPPPRMFAASTYDRERGRVVMFGGSGLYRLFNDTWEWDGEMWHRRNSAHRPQKRTGHAIAYDPERRVTVLFGGSSFSPNDVFFGETWEWDGTDWSKLTPVFSPPAREMHGMFYDEGLHQIIVYGGRSEAFDWLVDAWAWDGQQWTKLREPEAPACTWNKCGVAYDRGRQRGIMLTREQQTWQWDGGAWSLLSPATSPPAVTYPTTAYDDVHRKVFVFSGLADDLITASLWAWDGEDWSPASAPVPPPPRMSATMAFDERRGRLVVFGGDGRDHSGPTPPDYIGGSEDEEDPGILGDTWEYAEKGGFCAQPSQCASGNCIDGVCCDVPTCAPFLCSPSGSCLAECTSRTDCVEGAECSPEGKCEMLPEGDPDGEEGDGPTFDCGCAAVGTGRTWGALPAIVVLALAGLRRRSRRSGEERPQ